MTPLAHEMNIEGHTLAAVAFNSEARGQPVILLHGITAYYIPGWSIPGQSLFNRPTVARRSRT
jgi:hypothetical protein